ncbi:hypothetical protein [Avibacterium paragallinarum]|uniref:hypothetical protein n=1 Tax=Avibacterium paragallinarum TaxID=728 RepID=UPI00021ACD57|nr:hypothetical protein [Avibacterium paragallinarum]AZI13983.1 PspA [Avibacterium paragallinarum]
MNADYASVQEQSGIFVGDDGYQIDVRKHTDLKGGLITSTAQAETEGKNRFETGILSYSDIKNHANYSGSSFGLSGSVAMNFYTPLGEYGQAQSQKQAVNDKGEKLYIDSQGKQTTASRDSAGNTNQAKLAEGLDSLTGGMSFGFGSDKESQSSLTKSGINTTNLHIRDEQSQLAKTGKTVETTRGEISTDITTDTAEQHTGKLAQNFDKERLQKELDLQRDVTQDFDRNRQDVKNELYAIVDKKRENATLIRKINGGYDTGLSIQLDNEAADLDEKVRWLDMGLGLLQGSVGNTKTMLGVFAGTQADRVVRSATAPKEMWYQKCSSSNGDCSDNKNRRQIWSLSDLTNEEQANLKANGNVLTISNPDIFNDREDALKNAQKQNISETNQKGIIVVMNRPTGRYDGGWIATSLVSELMYAAYDKVNDKYLWGALPLNNSQKLNQDLYREAEQMGYQVDTSNHSRGGLTASIALQDMNIWKGETNIPIRKSRFYGTATNVQAYANQLQRNGYSYTGEDGTTYQSGAYSAVHKADFVGNKWGLGLVGNNEVTGGNCWICYSHSSYFAEVPNETIIDSHGNTIKNPAYKDFSEKWGEIDLKNPINSSLPKLIKPTNDGGGLDDNAF